MRLSTHFSLESYGLPVHPLHIAADVSHDGHEHHFDGHTIYCPACHDEGLPVHDWSELSHCQQNRVEDMLADLFDRAVAELEKQLKAEMDRFLPYNLRHLIEAGADSEAQNLLTMLRAINAACRAAKRAKEAA